MPEDHERASDNSTDDIAEVAELRVDRGENIREPVRLVSAVEQTVIEFVELFYGFILVVEDLDDFLTCHHLLNIAVDCTDVPLLLYKEAA